MTTFFLIIIESLAMCFLLLLYCVIGISNGPVGLVVLYEQDVQDRVVQLGYTTKSKIRNSFIISCFALFVPVFTLAPAMVFFLNGARTFTQIFTQLTAVLLIQGLFDRFFIDRWWVGKTKAWIIPGTEDLMPYIPLKVKVGKWLGTLVGYPAMAALTAWIITLLY